MMLRKHTCYNIEKERRRLDYSANKELVEKLAELTHQEWEEWTKTLVESGKLTPEKISSWKKLWVDYIDLSEDEKEKDRVWARKFLDVIEKNPKSKKPKKTKKITISHYTKLDLNSWGQIRKGFGKGIFEAGKKNEDIVALCADLKDSLKLTEFAQNFPNRFYEFGISEQNMASAAAGMTINSKIPFVVSYAAFNPGRNWDQIRVSICYSNTNVKIIGGHAGLTTGPDGATHQALEDIAITRVIPNLTVIVPCDEEQARQVTIAAAKHKGPIYIRLTREKSLNVTTKKDKFEIGKAQVLDEGSDITIIATGIATQFALEAREMLREENISAAVINLATIKPLDEKTILKYAKKTNKIITVEEHQVIGGMGSAVAEYLSRTYPIKIEMIGCEDTFGESGEGYELLKKYKISTEEIVKRAKKILKQK